MGRWLNRELSIAEYDSREECLASKPQMVFVELTQNCNLRCAMCKPASSFGRTWRPELDMTGPVFDAVARQLFGTALVVDLRGVGESTLLPNFVDRLATVVRAGARPRLVTNLSYRNDCVLDALVDTNAMLVFSLDAADQDLFAAFRERGSMSLVTRNLERLKIVRRAAGSCQDMRCNMVINSRNCTRITDVLDMIARFEVEHMCVWPIIDRLGNRNAVAGCVERALEGLSAGFERATSLGIELRVLDWPTIPQDARVLSRHTCIRPWMYVHINFDGTLGLCDCNTEPQGLRGLSLRTLAFETIWNGPAYRRLRRAFALGGESLAIADPFCAGTCAPRRFIEIDELFYPPFIERVVSNWTPPTTASHCR